MHSNDITNIAYLSFVFLHQIPDSSLNFVKFGFALGRYFLYLLIDLPFVAHHVWCYYSVVDFGGQLHGGVQHCNCEAHP